MIDSIISVLGIITATIYGLLFLVAMSKVFAIANDTRTMVVLLRRVLDQTADYEWTRRDDE